MNPEQLNLSNLQDIVLTSQPPLWPLAPGMWLVVFLIIGVVAAASYGLYATYNRNKYRRAGLVLLAEAHTRQEIKIILKRVCLAVFPWETVAPLYGEEWYNFLDDTCSRTSFSSPGPSPEEEPVAGFRKNAVKWIRYHKYKK